jgi:hypothetical protein
VSGLADTRDDSQALGDAVARRLIPLWLGATGYDWDPTYLLLAIDANVYLVHCIVFVTLVWLHSRPLLESQSATLVQVTLVLLLTESHLLTFLQAKVGLNEFAAVALRALLTLFFGLIAYRLYKYDLSNSEKKKSS